jgi:cation transport ATPase
MLPERPRWPSRPCPACGQPVDPLRAARVLWMEDGPRFSCGESCSVEFLDGRRGFDSSPPAAGVSDRPERPSIPDLVREATTAHPNVAGEGAAPPSGRRHDPLVATALAALGLGLVLATSSRELGWLAALLIALSAAVSARIRLAPLRATRSLSFVAPAGIALAVLGAVTASAPETQRWALVGAAVASIAVSLRGWIHGLALSPVSNLARELAGTLPSTARVPSPDASSYEEVLPARLRQGDLVVVLEGERAPEDGIIEEGSAVGLRYPKSETSIPYRKGDFILAGTRVVEGAITVRVRRAANERALARALELGRYEPRRLGWTWRLRVVLAHWSWLFVAGVALALFVWVGASAAAAWLLGAPLLATLAAVDVPLHAGGVAAAKRGMLFGSAGVMHRAGSTGTTAILLRGALTAGEPVVQQAQSLGAMSLERVLSLAAAAERAAETHPIAGAIRRYVEERGWREGSVRKERTLSGLGVAAVTSHGVAVLVGRRQLLLDEGISVAAADQEAKHIENEGLTPILVAVDGNLEALLAVLDPTHVGARDAIERIADLPSEVVILSGDDRRTVERIASNLGASRVKAPLLPEERVTEVRALRDTGGIVAAIGRGGEDDGVLAAADVPISLRLVGTAIEDRGITIASRDVRDAAGALWIARAVRRSIARTLGATALVTAIVATGASLGWLAPVAAALLATAADVWALRAGSRLLRRVDLREPTRQ